MKKIVFRWLIFMLASAVTVPGSCITVMTVNGSKEQKTIEISREKLANCQGDLAEYFKIQGCEESTLVCLNTLIGYTNPAGTGKYDRCTRDKSLCDTNLVTCKGDLEGYSNSGGTGAFDVCTKKRDELAAQLDKYTNGNGTGTLDVCVREKNELTAKLREKCVSSLTNVQAGTTSMLQKKMALWRIILSAAQENRAEATFLGIILLSGALAVDVGIRSLWRKPAQKTSA
jgi:hypothetical protein